jgi:hypothetical protein
MNLGPGIVGGKMSSALAEKVASVKDYRKIKISDRIHAAMIVISFVLLPVIIGMLPYFSLNFHKIFISFVDWKGKFDLFVWVKILIIVILAIPLMSAVYFLMFRPLEHMVFFIVFYFNHNMFVLAMAKY